LAAAREYADSAAKVFVIAWDLGSFENDVELHALHALARPQSWPTLLEE
jgi:hypothetical protein